MFKRFSLSELCNSSSGVTLGSLLRRFPASPLKPSLASANPVVKSRSSCLSACRSILQSWPLCPWHSSFRDVTRSLGAPPTALLGGPLLSWLVHVEVPQDRARFPPLAALPSRVCSNSLLTAFRAVAFDDHTQAIIRHPSPALTFSSHTLHPTHQPVSKAAGPNDHSLAG